MAFEATAEGKKNEEKEDEEDLREKSRKAYGQGKLSVKFLC